MAQILMFVWRFIFLVRMKDKIAEKKYLAEHEAKILEEKNKKPDYEKWVTRTSIALAGFFVSIFLALSLYSWYSDFQFYRYCSFESCKDMKYSYCKQKPFNWYCDCQEGFHLNQSVCRKSFKKLNLKILKKNSKLIK